MDVWKNQTENFIIENFSVSELHEFRKTGNGFEFQTEWKWEDTTYNHAWQAKAAASSRLAARNDMVRHSSTGFFPRKQLLAALVKNVDQI
jgi:hypothetical protein